MLVVTRKESQSIIIGDNIVVTVVAVRGDKVRLGIKAPGTCRFIERKCSTRSDSRRRSEPSAPSVRHDQPRSGWHGRVVTDDRPAGVPTAQSDQFAASSVPGPGWIIVAVGAPAAHPGRSDHQGTGSQTASSGAQTSESRNVPRQQLRQLLQPTAPAVNISIAVRTMSLFMI